MKKIKGRNPHPARRAKARRQAESWKLKPYQLHFYVAEHREKIVGGIVRHETVLEDGYDHGRIALGGKLWQLGELLLFAQIPWADGNIPNPYGLSPSKKNTSGSRIKQKCD